jgi:predicted transcriptional regulator
LIFKVKEAGLGSLFALSVPQYANVIDTIKFLYDNRISGVPIVDENNRVISNFSATDLVVSLFQEIHKLEEYYGKYFSYACLECSGFLFQYLRIHEGEDTR